MFIGHFALGFAAKRVTPRVSLAVLGAATQIADLLWPIFLAAGIEQVRIDPGNTAVTPLDFVSYPYSHSLAMLIVWGVVFAYLVVGSGFSRSYIVLTLLVVSHWFLDWITHRPDMPLYPGGARFGLGLWNSVGATVAIETAMYAFGLWIYVRSTQPRDGVGRWGFWALAVFLPVVYIGNILGPPPPSVTALWISAAAGGAVLVAWLWWVDRHRDVILSPRRVR